MTTTETRGTVDEPINSEQSLADITTNFITADSATYQRNHGPILDISPQDHIVTIDGLVQNSLKLTPAQLASDYPQHKVTCALECAGNRRHEMRTRLKEVQGIDWQAGAILNAVWEGPRLRDVLLQAGVKEDEVKGLHVGFACEAQTTQQDEWYGGSVPLERGMSIEGEVVLALKMNGTTLTPSHGFPVRAVVPGIIGARSVKWLDRITVASHESQNFYQQRDYKILPPQVTDAESAKQFWDKLPAMMDNPINSVVAVPGDDETIQLDQNGLAKVRGYALPQGSHGPVVKVEVSADEGKTWKEAELYTGGDLGSKWSWALWQIDIEMEKGEGKRIYSKATDTGGNTQTEARSEWNLRGVGYNGYESTTGLKVV